jgi:proteasome lid subunit RPN8/RPN11
MRALEVRAQEARQMGQAVEFVALGFYDPASEDVVWFELPNEAVDAEFHVEGEHILEVVTAAVEEGLADRIRVLWHSHPHSAEPSAYDIEHFPAWLATVGMVYHAATDSTVLYDGSGVQSSAANIQLKGSSSPALVPTEDVRGTDA